MNLNFMEPRQLYCTAKSRNENLIALDLGAKSCGIAVVYVATGYCLPIPYVDVPQNYSLSRLEIALRELVINFDSHRCVYDPLTPIQLLRPLDMLRSSIRIILNLVASAYNVGGFLVGFSADARNYSRSGNYGFISTMLSNLNADGGLRPRNFTFVDEMYSTEQANLRIASIYPQLSLENFNSYPMIQNFYAGDTDAFIKDFRTFRKGYVDCYAAMHFSYRFMRDCNCQMLYFDQVNIFKRWLMRNYAASLGYDEQIIFDLSHVALLQLMFPPRNLLVGTSE